VLCRRERGCVGASGVGLVVAGRMCRTHLVCKVDNSYDRRTGGATAEGRDSCNYENQKEKGTHRVDEKEPGSAICQAQYRITRMEFTVTGASVCGDPLCASGVFLGHLGVIVMGFAVGVII